MQLPDKLDAMTIDQGYAFLESLGWPEASKTTEIPEGLVGGIFDSVMLSGFDFEIPLKKARTVLLEELEELRQTAPLYMRSESYQSVDNAIMSLSRYFQRADFNFPDIEVGEIWTIVGEIFANSKLTPFDKIIARWEKKYGLGPLWRDPDSRKPRKLSRRKAIAMMGGYRRFKDVWSQTFKYAHTIIPVSGVSVKGEALPPKKWQNDVVRTVISAPLTHYITSTVWNYWANHNFKWGTTPIKVGMPLNGFHISRLVQEHMKYDHHFEGDFSDFDSTVSGVVVKKISEVRKKGFIHHRDFARICELIDMNYKQLATMPLALNNAGVIFNKYTGLSTGHSSTSMDNSLASVVLYLMAWKRLTGLSASEFKYYNKLSLYGDDHLLSFLATAPSVWNPHNIRRVMATFGVTLRDERPGGTLMQMGFLSKRWGSMPTADAEILKSAGIDVPSVAVWHDRLKLIGKATAPKHGARDKDFRAKVLTSYLSLCAHHPDVYSQLHRAIDLLLEGRKPPVPIPTYEQVVINWYNGDLNFSDELPDEKTPEDEIAAKLLLDYSTTTLLQFVAGALSILPDLVNPALYNAGYTSWIMKRLSPFIHWPLRLIAVANNARSRSHVASVTRKTIYDFLSDSIADLDYETDRRTHSELVLKHWLFCLLHQPKPADWSIQGMVNSVSLRLSSLHFLYNGYVQEGIVQLFPPLYNLLLVAALHFAPRVAIPEAFLNVRLPNPSVIVDQILGFVSNFLWSSVPANMVAVRAPMDSLGRGMIQPPLLLVEAPTGTGKSTVLIDYIWKHGQSRWSRIVVIEPRLLLVDTLTKYLRDEFGLRIHGVAGGMPHDKAHRLVMATPAEVFIHHWFDEPDVLFVLDEAHLDEPLYRFTRDVLIKHQKPCMALTATPDDALVQASGIRVRLEIASVWAKRKLAEHRIEAPDNALILSQYAKSVIDMSRSVPPNMSFLIFIPDVKMGEHLATKMPDTSLVLSSQNTTIRPARFTFATSVADVGLTLPNVDIVITMDVDRGVVGNDSFLYALDHRTITQRIGRVGRTHAGSYLIVRAAHNPTIRAKPTLSVGSLLQQVTAMGIPAECLKLYTPDYHIDIMREISANTGYNPTAEEEVRFWANAKVLQNSLRGPARHPNVLAEDYHVSMDETIIMGNTLATGLDDHKEGDAQQMVTASYFTAFVLKGAAYAALRGVELVPDKVKYWLRTSFVNSDTFKEGVEKGFPIERHTGIDGENLTILGKTYREADRFGRRAYPTVPAQTSLPRPDFSIDLARRDRDLAAAVATASTAPAPETPAAPKVGAWRPRRGRT